MTLTVILALCGVALVAGLIPAGRWRGWTILAASVVSLFVLQPSMPVRHLDFWLPTATLVLVALGWTITRPKETPVGLESWGAAGIMGGGVLLAGLAGLLGPVCCLTPTRPPMITQVLVGLVMAALLVFGLARLSPGKPAVAAVFFFILLAFFIVLKTEPLAQAASSGLRQMVGQSPALAKATDLRWLGFSYITFRILHTLRDHQNKRLPALSLPEYASYVVFFPALAAGPIDRAERFVKDLRQPSLDRWETVSAGSQRILAGLFKKFVLADTLALVALSESNHAQINSTLWVWVLVYAYALRIYFDFSGYTDIAIGMGRLAGIRLPENFDHPYIKLNLTAFWNSWHITLAQWFRVYFFNPLIRAMRTLKRPLPAIVVILVGQLATMALIGLWHGVTWNFLIWGAWHGLGLFIHNRWLDFYRTHLSTWTPAPSLQKGLSFLGWFLTFNYVTLGWVWFALPQPSQSMLVFQKLLGA